MDEQQLELAAQLEQAQRDAAIGEAGLALRCNGQPYCDDCGEVIPPARRVAIPSAIRCIFCQTHFEHR